MLKFFFYHNGKRFFRTGDLGRMVHGEFLKITGRIKEQYKLENGKYVVPAPLEDMLCRSKFIAQAFVYGDNRPHNVALIVPDAPELLAWARKNGMDVDGEGEEVMSNLLRDQKVVHLMKSEIIAAGSAMKGYERVKKYFPILEPFSQENHMLTPKLSLRRNNVMQTYGHTVKAMYSTSEDIGYNCENM